MNRMAWRGVLAILVMVVAALACSSSDPGSREELPPGGENVGSVANALSTTTHYEGEAMSWSGKNNIDGEIDTGPPVSRYFWVNGSIWTMHPFLGGPTTITLRARGELLGGVGPHVVVTVGGATVGSGYINNTSFASSTYAFTATAGAKELRITYDNDDKVGAQDRNLLVDWVEVSEDGSGEAECVGATYNAPSMAWSGKENVTGDINPGPPPYRNLWEDNSVWTSHPFTDGPARIRVRAAGDLMKNVGPHMVVSIDGMVLGDAYATTTFTDYDFDFTATAGTHVVKVTYDNDDCDVVCTAGRDRNLFLQTVSVICLSNDAGADGGDAAASDGGGGTTGDGGSSGGGDSGSDAGSGGDGGSSGGSDGGGGGEEDGGGGGAECTPASCTSNSPCLVAQCIDGVCTTTPVVLGTSCTDGNACNGEETCNGAGACVAGDPPVLDDGDICTIDSCDPATGIVHKRVNVPGCVPVIDPPELDTTVAPQMGSSTAFLYSGSSPVQLGVAPGTIETQRVGVVRGRVLDANGVSPKAGATVTIVGHPEFGQTFTRDDGGYDMAVNGGTTYVVHVAASGYLPMQRPALVNWHGWAVVEDMVLTQPYTSPDPFTVGSNKAHFVRGAVTPAGEDEDDARQATILFPENTHISNLAVADGTPLQVQLTEYTRGPQGKQRMPGVLPPTSGYTYAFEATLPAAAALGVDDVQFDRDVVVYVDNFTHYPVGEPVPTGYYNRTKGAWFAEKSGRIIKILSVAGGTATLDVTGDGVADAGAALSDLGMTASELTSLAAQYPAGTELWRVPIRHLSAWDCNWGFGPPDGAGPPPNPAPNDGNPDDPCLRAGSIIGCESRTLGENLPIVGTPFSLHYQSDRNPGFKRDLVFKISDATLPSPLPLRIIVQIDVLGRRFEYFEAPVPNKTFTWTWDGLDAYGRQVTGNVEARIRVGYEYAGSTTRSTSVFGAGPGTYGATIIDGNRAERTVTMWKEATFLLRGQEVKSLGFGGWTLDVQHVLDVDHQSLYRGDGQRRTSVKSLGQTVDTFAGGGPSLVYNDNGSAKEAYLGTINDLVQAADGSVYIVTDLTYGRIRRVSPDGIITTVAGLPPTVPKVDGAPALNAAVAPIAMAFGPDGALYFVDYTARQVWAIVPGSPPTLRHVAGNGIDMNNNGNCAPPASPNCGDGGDARLAELRSPSGIAVGVDGTVFVQDSSAYRTIRRIGPEGTISTYLNSTNWAEAISLRSDGVMFAKRYGDSLTRIEADGTIQPTNVTNMVQSEWCGFGGSFYGNVLARSDESFLVTCYSKIVERTPSGSIVRIAGADAGNVYGYAGDGGPALSALFGQMKPIMYGQKGDIYVGDRGSGRVRRLSATLGTTRAGSYVVPTEDASTSFEFDNTGRHARTLSGLKGTPIYTFGYDPTSHLVASVADSANNVTTVARTDGQITITAPHGQVTTLALDANGYLASVTNPAGETTHLAHTNTGLLTDLVDARGGAHHFEYDSTGRLTKDVDATPGSPGQRLASSSDGNGWTVDVTSAADRVTRHRVDRNGSFGDNAIVERRTISQGDLSTVINTKTDGSKSSVRSDGTKISVLATAADPLWGVSASFAQMMQTDVGYPATTHTMTRTESRTAAMTVPGDPFSVTGKTITTTLSGAGLANSTSMSIYAAGPPATWTTTSAAGRQLRQTLDSLERVIQVAVLGNDPVSLFPVNYQYDGQGRIEQVTQGARAYTTNYDPVTGWVESTTDSAGLGVSYTARDGNGRPLLVNLPGGRSLAMGYDAGGNVVSVTPPSKPAHDFSWDPQNRMSAYSPPNLGFVPKDTSYAYDFDGLLTSMLQPDKPATYAYDDLGRVVQVKDAVNKTYAYDGQGRLTSIVTSDGVSITNTYDGSLPAQQAVSGPFGHAINKTYDNFLRPSTWDVDGTGAVALAYDGDGLVTSTGGMTSMTVTRGNTGLLKSTVVGAVTDSFTYNGYGEMMGHTSTGYAASYTRDAAGRVETKTETMGGVAYSERYTYDGAGRLWQVFVNGAGMPYREWTYDANGNRADGVYDGQDRLISNDAAVFTYGPNGELSTKTEKATGAQTGYSYDANGNLRSVVRPVPLAGIDYVIDGLNRRIGKKIGGVLVQGFLYDGSRVVAELDAAGAEVSRFVYATGGNSPDLMIKGGVTYRIVKDHLGSVRLVVDVATGAVVQRMDYDEWGVVTADTNPGLQPFGFAGGIWDRDTGLVRFGARDYDPMVGRWTSKDDWGFGGWLNFYGYCYDDPINYIDPSGRLAGAPITVIVVGGGTGVGVGVGGVAAGGAVAGGIAIGVGAPFVVGSAIDAWNATGTPPADEGPDEGGAPMPGDSPYPGGNPGGDGPPTAPGPGGDDNDDCKRKATDWELKKACIDPHAAKGHLGPPGHFDICKCDGGGFAIKRRGCVGPIIERL